VSQFTYVDPHLGLNDGIVKNAGVAVCDLAYVNYLREKVRQLEAEERRLQAFGPTPSTRFVPFVLAADSSASDRFGTNSLGPSNGG
jgi:hypothetical protein